MKDILFSIFSYDTRIPIKSRYAFKFYSRAFLLIAIFHAFSSIFEIVLTKSFKATSHQISLIFTISTAANLISIFALRRVSANSKLRTMFYTISLGTLSFILLSITYFYKEPYLAIGLMSIYYLVHPIFVLGNNSLLRSIYDAKNRGKLFSLTQSIGFVISILVGLSVPLLLDFYPNSYAITFPIVGVLAFLGIYSLQKIKMPQAHSRNPVKESESILKSFFSVLNFRSPFLYFEIFFFTYGMGFLMSLPVQLTFFENDLKLNYTDFGIAWIMIPNILLAITTIGVGRLFDKIDPFRIASIFFLILAIFNFYLYQSQTLTEVFIAKAIYGIGMSGINIAWSLGPLYFTKEHESPEKYISAHIVMTGIRGLIAPQLGVWIAETYGTRQTFLTCSFFLVTASLGMAFLYWKFVKKQQNSSLHTLAK